MIKTITEINCPDNWKSTCDYDSHRPALWLALKHTTGDVVEFGMGHGSTVLLDMMCEEQGRQFDSYETDTSWYRDVLNSTNYWKGNLHLYDVEGYFAVQLPDNNGVYFVDSAPGEDRRRLINRNRNKFDVIVLHDTETGAQGIYGIKNMLTSFKWRLDFKPNGLPSTSILSDKINVCLWH